ncbi:MAG: hypothetical protein ACKPAJ_05875, partial [Actinomycetota bacterium]
MPKAATESTRQKNSALDGRVFDPLDLERVRRGYVPTARQSMQHARFKILWYMMCQASIILTLTSYELGAFGFVALFS